MSTVVKWAVIILLLVASALVPFLIFTRDQIGDQGYATWMVLVIYAYAPAVVANDRTVWWWAVIALCLFAVAAFAISLRKGIIPHEFEAWVSLAGWANLLSWALAVASRFARGFGRMDISGFGPSSPHSGGHLDAA
jgi:hypothetical protein